MTADQLSASRRWATLLYAAPLALLAAIIALGYLGFRAFVTVQALGSLNLYLLAVAAGVASFFSPCAFPLLPGYLSFYYLHEREADSARPNAWRALGLGAAAAAGVVTFSLVLGVIMAALGAGAAQGLAITGPTPNTWVLAFRGLVGVLLLYLGVAQITGWSRGSRAAVDWARWTRPQRVAEGSPAAALYLYGLGYSAAGVGCTGPILAGLMISALAAHGSAEAIGAFLVFSLVMAALMLMVSGLVAASQQALIARLKVTAPKVKRISGAVLLLVGAFHLYAATNAGAFVRLLFP